MFDPSPHKFRGLAYSTARKEHLLNVRADKMGVTPDEIDGFYTWLVKNNYSYAPHDFVPRKIYGAYLQEIAVASQQLALQKDIALKFVDIWVENIEKNEDCYRINSEYDVKKLVLATGNRLPDNPFAFDFAAFDKTKPVAVVGTGLTSVDTIMSLLKNGHTGGITAISRNGLFPQPHPALPHPAHKTGLRPENFKGQRLSGFFRLIKKEIQAPWQAGIDALRPMTQGLWDALSTKDKIRFVKRGLTWWNIHRHRMAESIHNTLQAAIKSGQVRIEQADFNKCDKNKYAHIFDCRGPSYAVHKITCLQKLLADGTVAAHETGLGLKILHGKYGVSASGAPPIYAIGNLLFGAYFETTAVPELREQAKEVAARLS